MSIRNIIKLSIFLILHFIRKIIKVLKNQGSEAVIKFL